MHYYKRKITKDEKETPSKYQYTQASINSDRCLTIRNYNYDNSSDEIIVLSNKETNAIFDLLKFIKEKEDTLPF